MEDQDSTDKYKLSIWALGVYPDIELTEDQYSNIKSSRSILSAAIAIEEKYEILLANYTELENECLRITAGNMVVRPIGYEGLFDIRLVLNRRLVNLLTATKLYYDQIERQMRICVPENPEIGQEAKRLFSEQYDAKFEYRFMEALRNYVQHCGLAVHSTSLGSRWKETDSGRLNEYKTSVFCLKSELSMDSDFKASVLAESPEKVDLLYAVRVYLSSFGNVHWNLRELMKSNVDAARDTVLGWIKKYAEPQDEGTTGLRAIHYRPASPIDETVESFPVIREWDDIRVELSNRNGRLVNLEKRYVSSCAIKVVTKT
jgi:hypothetical protein